MYKLLCLFLGCLVGSSLFSQQYYNDIVSSQQSGNNFKLLKQAGVKTVTGTSYEADDNQSENFSLTQELSKSRQTLTTRTTSINNVTTITVTTFMNDRIKKTVDSMMRGVVTTTTYQYDAAGKLTELTTQSIDPDHNGNTSEVHQWFYKENGTPDHMLKIKNLVDTVWVNFIYDEKNNLAEEQWRQKNRLINNYYYYYNDKGQMTDVVTFNTKFRKLLPDFTFEYDETGRITQMMQTIQGTNNYLLWKYTYNEKGLRQKEVCFNKTKQLVGRIEYSYAR